MKVYKEKVFVGFPSTDLKDTHFIESAFEWESLV